MRDRATMGVRMSVRGSEWRLSFNAPDGLAESVVTRKAPGRPTSLSASLCWPSPIQEHMSGGLAVANASAGARREPRGGSAKQRRRPCREGENDSTPPRAGDILLRAGSHLVDAPFRIRLR
jgi:hypothetical protein